MTEKAVRGRVLQSRVVGSGSVRRRGGYVSGSTPRERQRTVPLREDSRVIEELLSQTPANINVMRLDKYLHVSDLVSKCIRKIALTKESGKPAPRERLMDGHAITFAIGDAIHDFVKQKFIDAHPDKVWAIWSCPCNVTRTEPMLFSERPTRVCPECGLPVNKHNEPVLKHHRLPYTGALDLVIWLDEYQAFFIIEIKSISGKAFAELKRPQPDHKVQVSLYWDIMHGLGYPLVRQTGILYVNKEYSFKKVYEPFYQTQPQNDLIAPYKADAEAYLIYEKGGALPAKKMCPSVDSPNAKECPVRMECFARHKRGE